MKGTIDATLPDAEQLLMQDAKEAAEHATIVDLIRNDLSMVSEHVEVTSYRYIDRLQTNKRPHPPDQLRNMRDPPRRLYRTHRRHPLPPASRRFHHRCPQAQTVEIIAEAEDYERGFYTGIMGHYADGQLDSAVMIRFIEQKEPASTSRQEAASPPKAGGKANTTK